MSAAFNLGVMYANGTGTAADPVEAYAWLSVVKSRASGAEQKRAADALDTVAAALTPGQAADGQQRARTWLQQHK